MNGALTVLVKAEPEGPPLCHERVSLPDLLELLGELWLHACLRKGQTTLPLDNLQADVVADPRPEADARCSGFSLRLAQADGEKLSRHFSLKSLAPVARRAAAGLRESGALGAASRFFYEVEVEDGSCDVAAPIDGAEFDIQITRPALHLAQVPLASLMAKAELADEIEADEYPVFITKAALARAERCSRRGAASNPPVETGGVLAGSLCASPCGEFFVVVTDILEATNALQAPYSLGFSDQTWSRIQSLVRARQRTFPDRGFRLVGNCHGHNFLPNLAPTAEDPASCQTCPKRPSCSLTSVFVSEDDQNWNRAVFARQPWQLMHIFGLTARGEPVQKLFGLRDGRLQPRGFYVVPGFAME